MGPIEIWYSSGEGDETSQDGWPKGWYWWNCSPGCLPECDPIGPFHTYNQAYADAYPQED